MTQSAAKPILLACLLAAVGGCAALAPRDQLPGLTPPVVEVPPTVERNSFRSEDSSNGMNSVLPPAGHEGWDNALSAATTIRGQTPQYDAPPPGSYPGYGYAGGNSLDNSAPGNSDLTRQPMAASDATAQSGPLAPRVDGQAGSLSYGAGQPVNAFQPGVLPPAPPPGAYPFDPAAAGAQPFEVPPTVPLAPDQIFSSPSDLDVFVEEARTGRFSFGVAVNSNNG
ncbi:MAG TPA: hypothetical protein VMP01_00850, partial [Pirellulaceae bacterium]|nr:hypothetical protein [Pirellulaceae bacterium]